MVLEKFYIIRKFHRLGIFFYLVRNKYDPCLWYRSRGSSGFPAAFRIEIIY